MAAYLQKNEMNQAFSFLAITTCLMLGFHNPGRDAIHYYHFTAMNEFVVKKSITIKAKPAEVWDALTNPERTKNYFFHCRVYSDWKKGSPITFKGKIFLIKKIELKGSILDIEQYKLLKYELKNGSDTDTSSGKSVVTDVLRYENGETTVSVSDDVGSGEGAEKRYRRSEKGWKKILQGLKKEVEGKSN